MKNLLWGVPVGQRPGHCKNTSRIGLGEAPALIDPSCTGHFSENGWGSNPLRKAYLTDRRISTEPKRCLTCPVSELLPHLPLLEACASPDSGFT